MDTQLVNTATIFLTEEQREFANPTNVTLTLTKEQIRTVLEEIGILELIDTRECVKCKDIFVIRNEDDEFEQFTICDSCENWLCSKCSGRMFKMWREQNGKKSDDTMMCNKCMKT